MTDEVPLPLFVYGTLRSPEVVRTLVGPHVQGRKPAVAMGHRHEHPASFPAVSFDAPDEEIEGELIWFDPQDFAHVIWRLDEYEAVPDLFRRIRIRVRVGSEEADAYVYEWSHG